MEAFLFHELQKAEKNLYGPISLKLPNVKFSFDVSVAKHRYQTANVSVTLQIS